MEEPLELLSKRKNGTCHHWMQTFRQCELSVLEQFYTYALHFAKVVLMFFVILANTLAYT